MITTAEHPNLTKFVSMIRANGYVGADGTLARFLARGVIPARRMAEMADYPATKMIPRVAKPPRAISKQITAIVNDALIEAQALYGDGKLDTASN